MECSVVATHDWEGLIPCEVEPIKALEIGLERIGVEAAGRDHELIAGTGCEICRDIQGSGPTLKQRPTAGINAVVAVLDKPHPNDLLRPFIGLSGLSALLLTESN